MDHYHKIIIQKPEVRLFLQDDASRLKREPPRTYDLETEFAKTAHTRSFYVPLLMAAAFIFTALVAFGITKYIQYQNSKIKISVDVFEDLNLKKLLDMVAKTEAALKESQLQKKALEDLLQDDLRQLELDHATAKYGLNALGLSKTEKQKRLTQLEADYTLKVQAVKAKYGETISVLQQSIHDYEEQIAKFDSRNVEQAQAQQAILDSQRQFFELEKQELIKSHDEAAARLREQIADIKLQHSAEKLKIVEDTANIYQARINALDPVFTDKTAQGILASVKEIQKSSPEIVEIPNVPDDIKNKLSVVSGLYAQMDYVYGKLNTVPFQNSIPSYIRALRQLSVKAGDELGQTAVSFVAMLSAGYESKIAELDQQHSDAQAENKNLAAKVEELKNDLAHTSDVLDELRGQLEIYPSLLKYFETVSLATGDAGFVLDSSDRAKILVYISPVYTNEADGSAAYVFGRTGELLGTLFLQKKGEFFFAKLENQQISIKAGDRILLNIIKK